MTEEKVETEKITELAFKAGYQAAMDDVCTQLGHTEPDYDEEHSYLDKCGRCGKSLEEDKPYWPSQEQIDK